MTNTCDYVQQIALGLQHAFDKGLVHRDIKPRNLMRTRDGEEDLVKILDFGLAKATRENEEGTHGLTQTGALLGTPLYMAPEQWLDPAGADVRADLYSLGCTLHFLLTGSPPFQAKSRDGLLREHESTEPSPLDRLRPDVSPELATVVRKMMAKDPARRYQTPTEVARALAPFAKVGVKPLPPRPAPPKAGQRVAAPSPPIRETEMEDDDAIATTLKTAGARRSRKWLTVPLAVVLLLAGLVGLYAVIVLRVQTPEGILIVEVNEPNADVDVDGTKATVSWADGGHKAEIRVPPGRHEVELKKDGFTVHGNKVSIEEGKRSILTARLVRQLPPEPPADRDNSQQPASSLSSADYYYLTEGYRCVHFGKDRTRVVLSYSAEKQYFVRVYDLESGQPLTPPLKDAEYVIDAAFSPDGQRVITASNNRKVRLWDAPTGKEVAAPLMLEGIVGSHSLFSPDGQRVVTGNGSDFTAHLWDAATGEELTPPLKHAKPIECASFGPDGKRVVTACEDKTAQVWDAATGKEITPPLRHKDCVSRASFSPDGKRVVTASYDNTARMWDAATGKELTPPLKHEHRVDQASFSLDGKRVVTASWYKTAWLWDAATGEELKKVTITPD